MNKTVVTTATLVTTDGVPIDTVHLPGPKDHLPGPKDAGPKDAGSREAGSRDLAIVMAHGFTQSWQRPMVWAIAKRLNATAGVITFDFRGHGRSGGLSTLGDKEIHDLDVAVRYARQLSYRRVATVGFSMGGSVALRQAGLLGGADAVVSVSGPGHWYYRGTLAMRRVHFAAENRLGRFFARHVLDTRISPAGWPVPDPMPPAEAAARISPVPVLIVHGEADLFFPPEHGRELYNGAREPKELWLLPGFGHAERATDAALVDRIAAWAADAACRGARLVERDAVARNAAALPGTRGADVGAGAGPGVSPEPEPPGARGASSEAAAAS